MIARRLSFVASTSMLALAAMSGGPAHAQVVNIDATVSGCDFAHCGSGISVPVGAPVGIPISPVTLTLQAGTYTVTNADGMAGANPNFTAWRFNGGANWVWEFMIVNDADDTVLMQGCCGPSFSTQAAAGSQAFAQNFSQTFTLAGTTTLDFIIQDYGLNDNAGGVSLNIARAVAAVPEPSSYALMLGGLLAVGSIVRRRK